MPVEVGRKRKKKREEMKNEYNQNFLFGSVDNVKVGRKFRVDLALE